MKSGRFRARSSLIRYSVKILMGMMCISLLMGAGAFAGDSLVSFNIPSQDISKALEAIAIQGDISLVFSPEEVGTRQVPALSGEYSLEQALGILLKGTGLIFSHTGDNTISIRVAKESEKNSTAKEAGNHTALLASNGQTDVGGKQAADQSKSKSYDDFMLEEMIVTATKRPRKLQKVPMSIYAMSGQKMESAGIKSLEDIGDRVAGLEVISGGDGTIQLAARGVTNMRANFESTAAIGYYLDEIPISTFSTKMPGMAMWDVERIEVLRGPQGTLFGEGSMAGTVRIITSKPDSSKYSAKVGGDISSTETGGISHTEKGMVDRRVDAYQVDITDGFKGWSTDDIWANQYN